MLHWWWWMVGIGAGNGFGSLSLSLSLSIYLSISLQYIMENTYRIFDRIFGILDFFRLDVWWFLEDCWRRFWRLLVHSWRLFGRFFLLCLGYVFRYYLFSLYFLDIIIIPYNTVSLSLSLALVLSLSPSFSLSLSLSLSTVFYGKKYRIFDQIFLIWYFLDSIFGDFWRIWGVIVGGFLDAF